MKKLLLPAAMILSSGLTVVGSVHATNATATLNVTVVISTDCTVTTNTVDFLSVVTNTGANASGSVDVTCTNGTPYTIALDSGSNYAVPDRRVTDGLGNFLTYTLADSASAAAWGDDGTTIAGASVAGTGTGALVSHGVDATLVAGAVPAGTYSDIVNVTVTYY